MDPSVLQWLPLLLLVGFFTKLKDAIPRVPPPKGPSLGPSQVALPIKTLFQLIKVIFDEVYTCPQEKPVFAESAPADFLQFAVLDDIDSVDINPAWLTLGTSSERGMGKGDKNNKTQSTTTATTITSTTTQSSQYSTGPTASRGSFNDTILQVWRYVSERRAAELLSLCEELSMQEQSRDRDELLDFEQDGLASISL